MLPHCLQVPGEGVHEEASPAKDDRQHLIDLLEAQKGALTVAISSLRACRQQVDARIKQLRPRSNQFLFLFIGNLFRNEISQGLHLATLKSFN